MNSELYGNYEEYFIHDVIDFVESNFRAISDRNFRFAYGISMGGFGSAYYALKYPELFRAVCPSSAIFSLPDTLIYDWREAVYEENDGFVLDYDAGTRTKLLFTVSGGLAPIMEVEPWHFECIFDTLGNVVDTVYEKWQRYNVSNMVKDLSPEANLSFYLICGTLDQFIFYPTNLDFEDTLQKYNIDYKAAYYVGSHGVQDPVLTKRMFSWMDSLIAVSYTHLGLEDQLTIKHSTFNIAAYPNPFSEIVHFEFELGNSTSVSIGVFNAVGEKVAELSDGILPEGKHQIT